MSFKSRERTLQLRWKKETGSLSPAAKRPGLYTGPSRDSTPRRDEMFLHEDHCKENLLPEIRSEALTLFESIGVDWHDGPPSCLPSNYLMDSQVSCVNALLPLAHDAEALAAFFRPLVPGAVGACEVEASRLLTFEWIGLHNPLGEPFKERRRGANGTSLDAYCILETSHGKRVGLAIEWKYTESYKPGKYKGWTLDVYRPHFEAVDGPLDCRPIGGCAALFYEPLYQLARSQALAWRMEQAHELGVDEVRFVVVVPHENRAYRGTVTSPLMAKVFRDQGVVEAYQRLLRRPDRFICTSLADLMRAFDENKFRGIAAPLAEVRRRYVRGRDVG